MDIDSILEAIRKNYKKLYNEVMKENPYFAETKCEQICGCISGKIHSWLIATFPNDSNHFLYCSGRYVGKGTEYSGGRSGTYHCWVEIILPNRKDKIIIDGAYAQFFPPSTPLEERERLRLRIFMPEELEESWYVKSN